MKRKTISKLHLVYLIAVIPFCYSSCKLLNNSDNQEKYGNSEQSLHIMFYNVENLFDTLDDPRTNDNDFLPNGSYNWHSYRYYDKLNKIAKVVLATGGWDDIDLIGLCEIENRKVLDDLVFHTPLKSNKYEIIHKESPDRRGIDVALLYSRDKFKPIYYAFTKIIFPFDSSIRTRDILYAKGVVLNRDTLHLFVNHWPSRRGGKEVSEKRRVYVASVLREKVDSILKHNASSNIVIMGDFNDEPMDRSIQEILNAGFDSIDFTSSNLYNTCYQFKQQGKGSYKYRYEWNQLDQFIVSSNMLNNTTSLSLKPSDVDLFSQDWLLIEDSKYTGKKPFRTYLGPRYQGGYSDHLPIHMTIWIGK